MKRPMVTMLICVGILFGSIFMYHGFMSWKMKQFFAKQQAPTVTVSTITAQLADWQPLLSATGSLRAIRGVNVTTELAGMVQTIYFTPGSSVKKGTVLVQLNADTDIAQLRSLEANAELALITYKRDKAQYAVRAVSKATLDTDAANLKSLRAQVAEQAATVAKKTIKAPFNGRLGICNVNPGQFINPGDNVVSLQTLNPIYVDFYMPQQALAQLRVGQRVTVNSDTFPGKVFTGKITTINPAVDTNTRNVEVEATIDNPTFALTPGMFAAVKVDVGKPKPYLTLPQAAISYNSYGDIVYIVRPLPENQQPAKKEGQPLAMAAHQTFVVTGETRGDQVSVLKGIKPGDVVITSGQLKLKNGSPIIVNNTVQPANNPAPTVTDE
ncbi:MAG TPA: efflux RND transporter periplasmic adaptor subunit [Gammaproteobacteria bacterium]|nr:efflux RND transporter periplasmic adaptor subunit [Gammaproteobacteria bacterium]